MGNEMPANAFDTHTHSFAGYKCRTTFLTNNSYTDCYKVTPKSIEKEARIRKCVDNVQYAYGMKDDVMKWAAIFAYTDHPQHQSYTQATLACR